MVSEVPVAALVDVTSREQPEPGSWSHRTPCVNFFHRSRRRLLSQRLPGSHLWLGGASKSMNDMGWQSLLCGSVNECVATGVFLVERDTGGNARKARQLEEHER